MGQEMPPGGAVEEKSDSGMGWEMPMDGEVEEKLLSGMRQEKAGDNAAGAATEEIVLWGNCFRDK